MRERPFVLPLLVLVLVMGLSRPPPAHADVAIDVTLGEGAQDLADDLGIDVDELRARARDAIAAGLNLVDVRAYLQSFGDGTSFAARGTGVDYASNSELFTFGVAAGVGVDLEGVANDNDFSAGVGGTFTIMGGLNLARWHHRELSVFGNFFHSSTDDGVLRGGLLSLGAHVQYKLFQPTKGLKRLLAQWGGIDFTGGLELSRWHLSVGDEVGTAFDIEGDNGRGATLDARVDGHFGLSTTTVVLPVEVTTNVRLLYLLGLYVGAGLDLQVGRSSVDVGLGGDVTTTLDGDTRTIASIQVNANEGRRPSIVQAHALLGLQLNLWKLKFFVQTTMMPVSTVGFSTGLRLAW